MGFKKDQSYFPEAHRTPSIGANYPPQSADIEQLPLYEEEPPTYYSQPLTHSWSAQDPRSSSSQSLVPDESLYGGKRRLLMIYIHGFMGNETSFQSFPAHVHNLITVKLRETHQVHTKIYPRYKSRKAIEGARDYFSDWSASIRPSSVWQPRADFPQG